MCSVYKRILIYFFSYGNLQNCLQKVEADGFFRDFFNTNFSMYDILWLIGSNIHIIDRDQHEKMVLSEFTKKIRYNQNAELSKEMKTKKKFEIIIPKISLSSNYW